MPTQIDVHEMKNDESNIIATTIMSATSMNTSESTLVFISIIVISFHEKFNVAEFPMTKSE